MAARLATGHGPEVEARGHLAGGPCWPWTGRPSAAGGEVSLLRCSTFVRRQGNEGTVSASRRLGIALAPYHPRLMDAGTV